MYSTYTWTNLIPRLCLDSSQPLVTGRLAPGTLAPAKQRQQSLSAIATSRHCVAVSSVTADIYATQVPDTT